MLVIEPGAAALHPAKIYLNKKWLPKQKTTQNFNVDAQVFRKIRNANQGQISWHWLAGNFYFPRWGIFTFCFSEPFGINIEILSGLLLW